MVIPTPGGVPRALWMPSEEQIKKSAQQWKTIEPGEDGQNASEIALETSPTKIAMYIGVVLACVIGYFVFQSQQDKKKGPTGPSTPMDLTTIEAPKDLAPGELAGMCQQAVFTVEAVDGKGAVISKGPGFLAVKSVVATSLTGILGATTIRFRSWDGAVWQALNVVSMDDATDVVLLELPGLDRPPIPLDETGVTEPGSAAWIGWPVKSPASAAFAKSPGAGALRLSKSFISGAPVMGPTGKLLGMTVASAKGEHEVVPAKTILALAAKKQGLGIVEALSVEAGGMHRGDPLTVGRLLAKGRTAIAIKLLESEIARGGSGEAVVWLGEALLAEHRPRAAALRFATVKDSWKARRGEGRALLESWETPGALAAYRAAAASGGSADAGVLAGLAVALARAGNPAKAVVTAEAALNAADLDTRALSMAAIAGATARNDAVEKKALEALEKLKPSDSDLYLVRGECALARGDSAGAEKAFASAKDAGGGSRALASRGRALEALGQKDAARELYVEAADANPLDEDACIRAADALTAAQKRERALSVLSALLSADPAHAAANAAAGRALLATDPAKALPHLEQAAKADPDNAAFARLLAQGHTATGDRPSAENALAAFLTRHAHDEARIDLALLQASSAPQKSGPTLDAVRASTGPVAARASHARATALLALNKDAEARQAWDLAVSLDPLNGLYRFQRAVAAESGDLHESRALWEGYVVWAKKSAEDAARLQAAERRLLERFGR